MSEGPTYTRRQCQIIDAMFRMVSSGLTMVEEDIDWAARLSPGRIPPAKLDRLEQMRKRVELIRLLADLIASARWSAEQPRTGDGSFRDNQPRYSKRLPIFAATEPQHLAPEEVRSETDVTGLDRGARLDTKLRD